MGAQSDQITTRIFEVFELIFPPDFLEKKKLAGEDPLDPLTLDVTSDTPARSETAVTDGSDSVSHESMHRLRPNCWLNDEVVNFFLKVCLKKHDIILCDRNDGRKRSHAFSSFFMRTLFGQESSDPNECGTYNFAAVAR